MKSPKINRKLAVLSLLALSGTAGAAVTQCTAIYTSNYDSSNVGNVSAINMQTGAPMFTLASNQTSPNAVGLNPSDGYVYWVDQTVNAQGILFPQYSSKVYREKADGTGSVQQMGVISKGSNNADIIGGTFDASGTYYVMQTDGRVYKVANIAASSGTGALTTTSFDLNSSTIALYSTSNGDMAFDSSGNLWMIIEDTSRQAYIARVNSSTGAVISATLIKMPSGSVFNTTNGGVNGLTIDMVTGQFYVSSVAPAAPGVLRLDPTTGNTTSLTTTTYTDLGSCATVPNLPTLSKSFSPSNVTLTGGTATSTFTLTLGNSNQSPAYLYQALTDTMPAGMTIPSGATVSSTCTNGTPTVTPTSLTLPSGLSIPAGGCTVTVSSVSVSSAGTFTNTIAGGSLVTSIGTVSSAAAANLTVGSPAVPQFTVTKSDGGATFYTGGTATYTVTVTNTAANSSSSGAINIRDALPSGLTLASVAVASGSAVTGTLSNVSAAGSSGTVGWDFTPSTSMTQNQTATFILTVNVGASTPVGTNSITNYISVGGGGGAAVPTPGSTCSTSQCGQDSTTVAVPSGADLSVTKTDGTSSLTAGGSTIYTVRVTNKGPSTVTGAVLTDAAPSGLSFTSVTCSTASGNACSTAPTAAQLASGFALPTLAPGSFYELSVAASTSLSSGSVTNTASVALPSGSTDSVPSDNTASDTDSIVAASVSQPSANNTSYPATCDLVDWSKSGITGTAVGQTGIKNFNSFDGVPLSVNLVPATSGSNGIVGLNTGFTNYGSWYTVRAVSTSMSPSNTAPSYGGAFVTRAGGDSQTNTITITFPHPVINVRFGVTDLDAIGGSSNTDLGDWIRVTAAYGGTTFNPDTLIAGGHSLGVRGYTTTTGGIPGTAAAGASMTIPVPGRGNSSMGAGSNPNTLNTLMGIDASYGTQVTDKENGGSAVNRQGQGVVYFKGPLTTLTIVTGSKKTSGGNAIGFGNIDFCSPSMSVSKSAGTPVMQPDGTSNIPYSLTFSNTSYNTGLYPDTTVRDNPFLPSFATPAGLDPWADMKPQLSDNVVTQLKAVSNVQSATVIGTPKVSFGSTPTNTYNLDASDANAAFDGTDTNPLLMTGNTDARVKPGGSFTANFTVNLGLKSTAGTTQNVTNTATSSSTFNSGSFSATSNTVASVVSKPLPTPLSCTTMYGLTSSYSTVATGGTSPILTPTDQIQEITTGGLGGNIITQLPGIVSRNADGSLRVDAYALAISPDKRYLFIATNSTNSTDKNAFYYYDTQTGTWSTPFPLAAANSGAYQGPQRMVVTQSGLGYFSRNNYLYTFDANNPAAGIQGPFTMTAVYPNPQFPAPTPADINGGGDFVADTAGNLYVLSQPGTKDANGNLIYDGIFDLFKITGSGSNYTATFLGRVTTTKQNNPMVTWTGTAVVNNELYVQNNLGTMLKINLGNFETTTVTSAGKQTSDLASCSYLAVSPTIVSTKTVSDVNGGTVLVGDTLEYTITVRNAGNLLATQATFQDAIPAGTTYVPSSTTLNGTAVADVNGNMPYATTTSINSPGQSSGVLLTDGASSNAAVIKFRVKINTGTTSVSNQGTVSTVEGGTVRTDDPGTSAANDATVTPVAQPDLTITKTGPAYARPSIAAQPTATPPVAESLQSITYTLKVSNLSTATASSSGTVTVTDTLPAGLTATAISGTGWTCTLSTLTCTRSDVLAPGSSYPDLTVTVQAPFDTALETTPALRDFTNTAAISGGSDGNLTNNSASANTKMVYAKLLKTTRNVTRNTAFGTTSSGLPGEVLEYCIAFTNFGGAPLDSFTVKDSVPANTAALLTAYDAEETSTATGFGVKLTRAAVSYYTSAADLDQGSLIGTGGSYGSGLMTTALGTLNAGETGNTCFQVTIK